jgi:phosphonate transport system substrate-binding protein
MCAPRRFASGLLCLLVAASGGCRDRDQATLGQPENPLVVIVSPAHGKAFPEAVVALQGYLRGATGMTVEVRVPETAAASIEAFGDGKADVGLLTLVEYLLARREYGVAPRLQVLRDAGASFVGEIMVKADSDIKDLAGLQGRKLAFVDQYSMSGCILPARLLADARVKPLTEFAGSHEKAMTLLLEGKVDAIATFHGAAGTNANLRALATTPTVPNEPVIVHPKLESGKADKIVNALVAFAATPEGKRTLHDLSDITGFAPVTSQTYRGVAEVIAAAGKGIEELVPGGQAIAAANRQLTAND